MTQQILVVDDDTKITSFLRRSLALEGYQVRVANSGAEGLQEVAGNPPDMLILDIMMPGLDGLEVCRRVRAAGETFPILLLTARDAVADRVKGLDIGADDYLVKPFALEELLARVRAHIRRGRAPKDEPVSKNTLTYGDVVVDMDAREVRRGARMIELTAKEFELLALFMANPRHVLTRDTLMERVWGYDYAGESNVLEVYVGYLRQKLEAGGEPRIIQTVRGVGYVLKE